MPSFRRRPGPLSRGREIIEPPPPRKEDAECCQAKTLEDGRPVIGYCGPDCIRRPEIWERIR